MNKSVKKVFSIILLIIFIGFNLIHLPFLYQLIREDIISGTVHGTSIEMLALVPWIIEIISIPCIIGQIIYLIILRKQKINDKANLIIYILYIIQIVLFNILVEL